MLIDALGAGEYWGQNVNGDIFPEAALEHDGPDYGARTFELYAHPFKHHANKDPARAYGDKVTMARYYKPTGRVQLIVAYHNDKAKDIIEDVDGGNYPSVSMGARVPNDRCFPAGTLVRTVGGHRPIESIMVGDLVLTHRGRLRKVTAVIRSKTDALAVIKGSGLPAITSTTEHPYYILPRDTIRTCYGSANGNKRRHVIAGETCSLCKKRVEFSPGFVAAEDVRPGDYALHPVDQCGSVFTVGVQVARLLGYYAGDGFIVRQRTGRKKDGDYRDMGINITSNIHRQSHVDRVVSTILEVSTGEPKLYEHAEKNAVEIRLYDQELAATMDRYVGRYSAEKRLSEDVFAWHREEKLNFLGGYIDTDGSVDASGNIRITSINRGLILDAQRLAHSVGIPASTVFHGMPESTFGEPVRTWAVYIPGSRATELSPFSERVKACEHTEKKWSSSSSFFFNGYWCSRVISVTVKETGADVYNLSVEEDESYIAEGYAVHNCTICGNLAKTRANYCEHAKYQMGKILSDGRQVGVINDRPKFFDISVVLVGAEKASHILKKVAQSQRAYAVSSAEAWDKLSGDKVSAQTKDADIDKEVPSNLPPDEQVRPVSELMDAASDVKNTEKTISGKELDDLAGFPMKELYSTLAALGIPLKPHEFQRVMLVKSGQRKLAEELWRDGVVFDESSGVPPRDSTGLTYDPRAVNEKIAFMLRPYLRERSIYPEAIEARVVGFEKRAEDWYNQKARQPPPSLLIPVMVTLAGAYKMFKDRLPQVQRGAFERSVEAHPWLLPLLLGLGFATAAAARTALTPIQLHNQAPFDGSVYAKYAVDKSASWKRLGVIPAAYAYSGVQRHRAMQGEHLNWLDRTVAQRPEIAALGGFLLAPSLGRGLKRVGLSKGASAAGDLAMMSVASGPKFIPGVLAGMAIDMGVVKGLQSIAGRRKRHNADNARRAPGLVQPLG